MSSLTELEIDLNLVSLQTRKLVEATCRTASLKGIAVRLLQQESVGGRFNGMFDARDGETPALVVACGKPESDWLPVLLHESCHMDQFIARSGVWLDQSVTREWDSMSLLLLWLDHLVELSDSQLDSYVRRSRNVEWDCERRALLKINDMGLPLDPVDYACKANSYIWLYTCWLQKHRKWYTTGREPWKIPQIWTNLAGILAPNPAAYDIAPDSVQRLYDTFMPAEDAG